CLSSVLKASVCAVIRNSPQRHKGTKVHKGNTTGIPTGFCIPLCAFVSLCLCGEFFSPETLDHPCRCPQVGDDPIGFHHQLRLALPCHAGLDEKGPAASGFSSQNVRLLVADGEAAGQIEVELAGRLQQHS